MCTLTYINNLQQENRKQKEIIDETINAIDLVIELIKQQPTKDDRWILDRLNVKFVLFLCSSNKSNHSLLSLYSLFTIIIS